MGALKEPHGGELKNLYLQGKAARAQKQAAGDYPSWDSSAEVGTVGCQSRRQVRLRR